MRKPAQERIRAARGLEWADGSPPAGSGDDRLAGRCPRASTLFQFGSRRLRYGIAPDFLPVHIHEQPDLV